MILSIRLNKTHNQPIALAAQPEQLQTDTGQHTNGIPWLHGEVGVALPQSLTLTLRLHNRSGIPVIEGQCNLKAGQQQFTFCELRPLGIEAYGHASKAERDQIGRRIWSRVAYGKLTFLLPYENE